MWSIHLYSYLEHTLTSQGSDLLFSHNSMHTATITHEQKVICSKTHFIIVGITQELTIICRKLFAGLVVGTRPMKGKKKMHGMIKLLTCCCHPWIWFLPIPVTTVRHQFQVAPAIWRFADSVYTQNPTDIFWRQTWLCRRLYFMARTIIIPLSITPHKTIVFLIKMNIRKVVLVWKRAWQDTEIVYYHFTHVSVYIKRHTKKPKTKLAS